MARPVAHLHDLMEVGKRQRQHGSFAATTRKAPWSSFAVLFVLLVLYVFVTGAAAQEATTAVNPGVIDGEVRDDEAGM